MNKYTLIQNTVHTYPNVLASRYDVVLAKQILQGFGATEIHDVRRIDTVPSSGIHSFSSSTITHNEVCFALPTRVQFNASERGSALASSKANHVYLIEKELRERLQPLLRTGAKSGPEFIFAPWALGAEQVYNFCQQVSTYMDVSLEDFGIEISTRDNGDVGEEAVGAADVKEVRKVADAIKVKFPHLKVEFEPCDEWVSLVIGFDAITPAALAQAD